MKPPLNLKIRGQLEDLSRVLGEYRKKHGTGCNLSRDIWDQAIALCEYASVAQVAQGIGVSSTGLRQQQRASRRGPKSVSKPREPRFLEIGLDMTMPFRSPSVPSGEVLKGAEGLRYVELQRTDGSCLRISDLNAHGLDLLALIHGFMGPVPSTIQGGLR